METSDACLGVRGESLFHALAGGEQAGQAAEGSRGAGLRTWCEPACEVAGAAAAAIVGGAGQSGGLGFDDHGVAVLDGQGGGDGWMGVHGAPSVSSSGSSLRRRRAGRHP